MKIPFLTQYACVWQYPLRYEAPVEEDGLVQFKRLVSAMKGDEWSVHEEKQKVRYERRSVVHWKKVLSPDDLPPELDIKNIKMSTIKSDPIERCIIVIGGHNEIYQCQGHTWVTSLQERGRYMRGFVAGITCLPWLARNWVATGSVRGMKAIDLPADEGDHK